MDNRDDSVDMDEWERIEQDSSPGTSPTSLPQSIIGWDMVVVNEDYLPVDQVSSIDEPPSPIQHHEGSSETAAATTTEDTEDRDSSPPPEDSPPLPDWRLRIASEGGKLLRLRLEAARDAVVRAAARARELAVCAGAFWSVACVAGAAAAAVVVAAYVGIRRQRRRRGADQRQSVEHLAYLLREKDEKISQLLLQIGQLNEALTSRRKVPVLRIST